VAGCARDGGFGEGWVMVPRARVIIIYFREGVGAWMRRWYLGEDKRVSLEPKKSPGGTNQRSTRALCWFIPAPEQSFKTYARSRR
jgi:hypothetical protein